MGRAALAAIHALPAARLAVRSRALGVRGAAIRLGAAAPDALAGDELLAAAPAYVKDDSDGDFARDWDLASSISRGRVPYYPKLALTVPFTPCTGERVLVAPTRIGPAAWPGSRTRRASSATTRAIRPGRSSFRTRRARGSWSRPEWRRGSPGSSTGATRDTARWATSSRASIPSAGTCSSARWRAAEEQGITIRTIRGEELRRDPARWAKTAHALHRSTVDKLMWGRRWLNERFYLQAFAGMPDAVEVVAAFRGKELVAGAFNVAGGRASTAGTGAASRSTPSSTSTSATTTRSQTASRAGSRSSRAAPAASTSCPRLLAGPDLVGARLFRCAPRRRGPRASLPGNSGAGGEHRAVDAGVAIFKAAS